MESRVFRMLWASLFSSGACCLLFAAFQSLVEKDLLYWRKNAWVLFLSDLAPWWFCFLARSLFSEMHFQKKLIRTVLTNRSAVDNIKVFFCKRFLSKRNSGIRVNDGRSDDSSNDLQSYHFTLWCKLWSYRRHARAARNIKMSTSILQLVLDGSSNIFEIMHL